MTKKPTVTTLASGFNSTETLNANFEALRDSFDNTLSLDGSTPNAMEADLDLNGNNLIGATAIMVGGSDVVATTAAALAAAVQAQIEADAAVVASALSETNAANSATASQTSATASQASRLAAETAETNAETAETNAETAETNSQTSATNSAASANAALGSETAASGSAAAALASQVAANTSQGNASVSALAASNSETAAALSETNAATSETNAATSETNAAASETAASSSATAAVASETAAATSETNAATSETNAAASAVTATTGATTATAQAIIATDQATQAAADVASIQGAAGAAVDAANSAAAAAAALDNFDDRYLGPKSSEPTVDNDGDALVSGSLYFSTISNAMQVYDGANWIAASASGVASMILYEYTATAGQTTFTGSDDNNNSISFIQGNEIVVFNGIILDPSDYNSTSGTSIVLNVAAALNDLINVYAFKSFTVADTVQASTGGTFGGDVAVTGNITVTGTVDGRDVAADGALAASALQPTGDGSQLTGLPAGYTDTDVATYLAGVGNVVVGGTVDGVDIAARDAILTSTTTTANAAIPKVGGTLTGDLSFGDNDKAIFGAGSDLQIYHDGSNSYVTDTGTGDLIIDSNGNAIRLKGTNGENMIVADTDASAKLFYDGSQKLATTSTGVNVTGAITSDGLTVDGVGSFTSDVSSDTDILTFVGTSWGDDELLSIPFNRGSNTLGKISVAAAGAGQSGVMRLYTGSGGTSTERIKIGSNGDISFYEDTGTTPKFFWDASAERLGIGTSSPSAHLDVQSSGDTLVNVKSNGTGDADATLVLDSADTGESVLQFEHDGVYGAKIEWFTDGEPDLNLTTVGATSVIDMQPNGARTGRFDTSGLEVTGTVTATSFSGDGSNLTGVGGSTTAGAVGTYMWARGLGSTTARPTFNFGSTYAGSGLYPAGFASQTAASTSGSWYYSSGVGIGIGPTSTAARSGTWRCMGQTPTPSFDEMPTALFVRIS